jgi:uncharacterized protein YodC (DUF2158 family)
MLKQKEPQMTVATRNPALNQWDQEQREIHMYGCTAAELRESVEDSITFKCAGPAMLVASIMSDTQEMLAFSGIDNNETREQVRQMLNQCKWILATYVMKGK